MTRTVGGQRKRVALVASYAPSLVSFRGSLISDLKARGHDILCLAPDFTPDIVSRLEALGADVAAYPLERTGLNPVADYKSLDALTKIFKAWRGDVVMGYTAKPAIYASLAARRARVPRIVPMITGLGYAFLEGQGALGKTVQAAMRQLYWAALKVSHGVIFHNQDDRRVLEDLGVVPKTLPVHVVSGSGVDLDHYGEAPLPPLERGLVFLLIARLVRYKGLEEYCAAARIVKSRAPQARFLLVGPEETGPAGFPVADLSQYGDAIEYQGPMTDVRPAMAGCHVYVLPSYGEGMPRTVLEALAMGRPIITTDTRGCRETVDERVNGCLVPVGDAEALASAMESFLKRPDLIPSMARASRLKAERRFDVRLVNQDMMAALGLS